MDGWGIAPFHEGNAIARANKPVIDNLIKSYPVMTLNASGRAVGLSWGEIGNSEVGHLTIGAGKVFYQKMPLIDKAIEDKVFFTNKALLKAAEHVKSNGSTLHLMGLVSIGGVHSHMNHLFALLDFAKEQGIKNIAIHAFLDGRDTDYNSGLGFIQDLQKKIKQVKIGEIATLSGRYFAMDRDNRWDRVEKAYNTIALGQSEQVCDDSIKAIKQSYDQEIYDEEFKPTVITRRGKPVGCVSDGDAVVFFNFRADRARQLTKAFVLPDFDKFQRQKIQNLLMVTMSEYEKGLPVEIAFPPKDISTCLGCVVANAGLKQLHISETEKYAHVTFFINGEREDPMPGEDRVIIPSPRVSSYDQKPEMSALEITDRVLKEISQDKYDFIVLNYANTDMVGHTGNLEAGIKATEIVDKCIGKLTTAALARGGAMFITADHGNAEVMINLQTGEIDKQHTTNPVPFIIAAKRFEGMASPAGEIPGGDLSLMPPVGMLADIGPTIFKMMHLAAPPDMVGTSLI